MTTLKSTLPTLLAATVLLLPASTTAQHPQPPATEAEALRMLAAEDYRERDAAMSFVASLVNAGLPVDAGLRDAMMHALEHSAWMAGRPTVDPELNPDGWGEYWSMFRDVVTDMRDPATIPFLLDNGTGVYVLADMGRATLAPAIEAVADPALTDPETHIQYNVSTALEVLTLLVHDGVPTPQERDAIVAAVRYRMGTPFSVFAASPAFGLAVTLGTPDLLAFVEAAATDRRTAAAMAGPGSPEDSMEYIQELAREALQPDFVPDVVRWRRDPN